MSRAQRVVAVAVGVIAAASLAACGGSGSRGASSGATSGTAPSSGADPATFCADARDLVGTLRGNVLDDTRGAKRLAAQIDALTPPAEVADEWPAFLDYVHQLATISPTDPDAGAKALSVLSSMPSDVTVVATYLVNTCQIDVAASDLTDLSG